MIQQILTLYMKDMRETLRNKRFILRLLILPGFLLPAMAHFMTEYAQQYRQDAESSVLNYTIVGADWMPDLAKSYAEDETLNLIDIKDEEEAKRAIRKGLIKFALIIPPQARERLNTGASITVKLYFDNSKSSQTITIDRATEFVRQASDRLRDWRLTLRGVTGNTDKENLLTPIAVDEIGTASQRESLGQTLGGLLAYFIFLICYMGCVFTALDLGAGEKERGTLETLLMLPVSRDVLVFGKFLVVFTMGTLYATVSLLSISLWLLIRGANGDAIPEEILTIIYSADLLYVWLMLLPVAAIFSALLLSISIYARSYREASGMAGLANVLVIMLTMIAILPGMSIDSMLAFVPITNVSLSIREIIKGTMDNYQGLMITIASGTGIALALLYFCRTWFNRESVLFRE
ncbi:MAG: ABC transporter permease [Wenzhouxiangellaceae bacterium]